VTGAPSEVWWGLEAEPGDRPPMVPGPGPAGIQPELLTATRESVRAAIRARIRGFTPDWTNLARDDAGVALVRLFGTMAEPVLRRVNRLPEKALVEHLRIAGVQPLPATAAAALLEFTVSAAAGRSVLVPPGYQAGAAPAIGQGEQVVFETEHAVQATPATIGGAAVEEAGLVAEVDLGAAAARPFPAFGADPRPGNALWVGLALDPAVASPSPSLAIGLVAAAPAGAPPAAAGGGVAPLPVPPPPLLRWELLDGGRRVPVELLRDETGSLRRTGVVELGLPRSWRPGRPPGGPGLPELLWLRVEFVQGTYPAPPSLAAVRVNLARATAVRTIRDEVLERTEDGPGDGLTRMRVSQVPVLPGSLVVEVDDDPGGDVFGTEGGEAGASSRWEEVDSLAVHGPGAQVFEVDHAAGELTFGDGIHGARVPQGFRNVRAVVYRAGGGAQGRVDAQAVSTPVTSVPFVDAVTNPFPASGGVDAEADAAAIRRGPDELRSRGRAVTPADYAALARRAPGAEVARAHGVAGLHPDFPGAAIPGVVGVLVVGPDRADGPPYPTEADLQAVTAFLTRTVAPAGVEVVAAAPRFHRVQVEAQVVLDPDEAATEVVRQAGDALRRYLHPLQGGDAATGWPFGGTLRHVALVRLLLGVDGVLAVPQLNVVLDGVRQPPCTDRPIAAHALLWPDGHELLPVEQRGAP
jgi:predicted phage baseplate assembly protein